MRRRSKPRVVWLPGTNENSVGTLNRTIMQTAVRIVPVAADGIDATANLEIPVVFDGVLSDPLNPSSSLSDIENSGYRLRRIVGKVWIFMAQSVAFGGTNILQCTAGFIIRRTDPETGGSLASAAGAANLSVTDIESCGDPWIWRRSWLLADDGTDGDPSDGVNANPHQNFGPAYPGGIAEGPHVDQKTARIVGPEERLFLDFSFQSLVVGDARDAVAVIATDLRVLASMRSSVGNRRNASR